MSHQITPKHLTPWQGQIFSQTFCFHASVCFVRPTGNLIGGNTRITVHALLQELPLFVSFRSKLCVTTSDCRFESWVPLGELFCNFLYILIADICYALLALCSCISRVFAPAANTFPSLHTMPHAVQLNDTHYIPSLGPNLLFIHSFISIQP